MKYLLAFFLIHLSAVAGEIVLDDVRLEKDNSWPFSSGNTYAFTLTKSIPISQGAFGFAFDFAGETAFRANGMGHWATIAEVFALFLVTEGTVIDADYVANHQPFLTNAVAMTFSFEIPLGGDVLVAYWDDRQLYSDNPLHNIPDPSDSFGWARLSNISGILVLTESATALGDGIVAGSTVPIPEPSSWHLILGSLALCTLLAFSRQSRRFVQRLIEM